jgi:glycosyltransferase involved in cell wall biosynthesis
MQIVFVGPFGLQPKGTMSGRALPLARALVAKGHSVTVLIPPWDDPDRAGKVWGDQGVQVVNVDLPQGKVARLPLLFHILLTRRLVSRTLALQPDVVHLFKPKAYAGLSHWVLWWLRRWRGLSLRLVVDADDWEQAWNEVLPYSPVQKKLFAWQETWGLSHADAVTVASRALEELVITQIGADPARVYYVPNGCCSTVRTADRRSPTTDKLSISDLDASSEPTILLFSRFAEFKLERVVTMVRLVAEQAPAARWLIVGRGFRGEEKTLEAKLTRAGLDQYVHFISEWIPPDQVPTYFTAADVAVHPYDDTLLNRTKCSVKLIDLLAAGVPVVADAVGQNCEYIQPEVSGMLVPAEDDEAFAQAVISLLQEPETRHKMGQAATQFIQENFSWSQLIDTVERAYR